MATINLRPSLPDSATPAQLQEIRERLVLVSPAANNAAVAAPDGGVYVPQTTAQSAGNLRAPQVAGTARGTPPVPGDLGLTAFVEDTEILRSTAIGIEQRFLVNASGIAVLDREFPPDDTRPLTTVPSVLAGTGWVVGDTFVLYDSANDSYDKYRVETMGPVQVARKKNFGGTSSGTTATPMVRTTVVNTVAAAQSVTFDGVAGELRVYRNGGANLLTIQSGVGVAFSGGAAYLTSDAEFDTVALSLSGSTIEVISNLPR